MYIFTSIANSEHDVTSTIDNSETSQDCTHFLESRKICSHLDLCFNVSYFNSRLLLFILSFGGHFVHLLIVDSRAMTGTEGRKREMGNDMHQKLDVNQPPGCPCSEVFFTLTSYHGELALKLSFHDTCCIAPVQHGSSYNPENVELKTKFDNCEISRYRILFLDHMTDC